MKKLLMPFLVLLALVVTISSCKPEDEECTICGEYDGTVSGDLKVIFGDLVDTDTTISNVPATATLDETAYDDSLALGVDLVIDGTPISVTVNVFKNTETTFSVVNTIYKYLGAVPLLVNGTGSVTDGNTAMANIKLTEADGSTDAIDADLDFVGTK